MLFSEALDDYVRSLRHERRASPATAVCYASWLRRYEKWLAEKGYTCSAKPATLEHFAPIILRRYQIELSEKGYRPRTIRSAFHPLRGLGVFLVEHKLIEHSPAHELSMPKKDAAQRYVVSDADLQKLLETTDLQRDKTQAAYERALLSVAIYTMARAGEIEAMQIGHVDLDAGTLLIPHGKGNKSRTVFLADECIAALRVWLRLRPVVRHDWMWPCDIRRRKSADTLRKDFEDVKARAGLAHLTGLKFHSMRHAGATRMLRNGADLLSISAGLGHSDLRTTYQYLHHQEQAARAMATTTQFQVPTPVPQSNPQPDAPVRPSRAALVQRMRRRLVS